MDMLETIKFILGDNNDYTDLFLSTILDQTISEIEIYCNRPIDKELESVVVRLVIIRLNRLNSEGLSSQAYSGITESYIDGYPSDIKAILNRKRKLKLL